MIAAALSVILLVALTANAQSFTEFTTIPTHTATDVEFFQIGKTTYLAFAELFSAKIYSYKGESFTLFQDIAHAICTGVTFFTIDGESYLAVSSYINDYGTIYKYNPIFRQFYEYQQIHIATPRKFQFTQIGNNYYIGTSNTVAHSSLYLWNGTQFNLFQQVPGNAPQDLAFLTVNTTTFLAVASAGTEQSLLWVFNENQNKFVELAAFKGVSHATDLAFWTIDYNVYVGFSSTTKVTWVWQWNFSTSQFDLIQVLDNTSGDSSLTPFATASHGVMLAVAATGNAPVHDAQSQVFSWNGEQFQLFQELNTALTARFAAVVASDNTLFLAAAETVYNHNEVVNSTVYSLQ